MEMEEIKNILEKAICDVATATIKINQPIGYSDRALLDSLLIFQSVLMEKIYENQNYDDMGLKDRCDMVEHCGNELKKLIHTYTGIDTFKLVEEYNK